MFRILIILFIVLFLSSSNIAFADTQQKAAKAVSVAKSWLSLVDNGKYTESWDQAASYFKSAVSKRQWQQMLPGVREPLGHVISRKLKSASYATSLPGAPDGEYVVIQFNTSFANKQSAVETITPMLDPDKKWRVSGYFIK